MSLRLFKRHKTCKLHKIFQCPTVLLKSSISGGEKKIIEKAVNYQTVTVLETEYPNQKTDSYFKVKLRTLSKTNFDDVSIVFEWKILKSNTNTTKLSLHLQKQTNKKFGWPPLLNKIKDNKGQRETTYLTGNMKASPIKMQTRSPNVLISYNTDLRSYIINTP